MRFRELTSMASVARKYLLDHLFSNIECLLCASGNMVIVSQQHLAPTSQKPYEDVCKAQ